MQNESTNEAKETQKNTYMVLLLSQNSTKLEKYQIKLKVFS